MLKATRKSLSLSSYIYIDLYIHFQAILHVDKQLQNNKNDALYIFQPLVK